MGVWKRVITFAVQNADGKVHVHCFKGLFHGPTEIYKINHRCIQIDRRVLQTIQHRRIDIGAILTAD